MYTIIAIRRIYLANYVISADAGLARWRYFLFVFLTFFCGIFFFRLFFGIWRICIRCIFLFSSDHFCEKFIFVFFLSWGFWNYVRPNYLHLRYYDDWIVTIINYKAIKCVTSANSAFLCECRASHNPGCGGTRQRTPPIKAMTGCTYKASRDRFKLQQNHELRGSSQTRQSDARSRASPNRMEWSWVRTHLSGSTVVSETSDQI